MMNNSGALYIEYPDAGRVAAEVRRYLLAQGYHETEHPPGAMSGRIMIPEKRRRLFFVVPPHNGWVTIWEDPRYFGDRFLARDLARTLATRTVWIEVSGNSVGWARGVYAADAVLEEHFEEMETTFYGEYGTIHFAFDIETTPDEFITQLNLPYPDLFYEAVVAGDLPATAGTPIHLAFERAWPSGPAEPMGPRSETERHAA